MQTATKGVFYFTIMVNIQKLTKKVKRKFSLDYEVMCSPPKYFGHFLFKTMANLKKSSTNIVEEARRELDISRDDYALCQYLHYRQGYPNDKMPGWCIDTKDEISDFVGISRPGLYKMIDRLERIGLAESMPTTGFLRTTKLFIDTETGCKQSLQSEKSDSVNKVYKAV